ncbi:MAG: ATP-binding cassette domain-containing protein [Thermoleophilaceae bacterium]
MAESVGERETVVAFEGGELTLGQANVNSVVLQGEGVSRFHATIVLSGGELELRDLDTKTGTRLDGRPIKRAVIDDGALIEIGQHRLRFDSSSFLSQTGKGALRLDAAGVAVRRDGKDILKPISLSISPGELVAVIGESGSGKTTLLRALAGVSRPSAGRVTLNGEPVTSRLTEVGYVPQDEIVHPLLTVDEALDYAAKLRLPGANDREVKSTVDRVLAELALEPHRRTRIGHLSGGQRKRVGVGSELLHRPSLLFLDEPTTGLDPVLESQMMALFRYLARPAARGVVLVTHATQSLSLCDTLVVLARGGELCFRGSPDDALEFFGVPSHDKIYAALEERPSSEWRSRLEERRGVAEPAAEPSEPAKHEPAPKVRRNAAAQAGVLVSRYLRLFFRDRRNAFTLFGQVPLIALGIAFLFQSGVFNRVGSGNGMPGQPREQIQLLFLLVTTAIWFGLISASREIVKERAVTSREAAVGVKWSAYLVSKATVLFAVSALQTVALAYFVFALRPLDEPASAYAAVTVLLVLSSWVAVGVGLVVSAAASTEDQATSVIPLTLIPQLLFAGAVVPPERMTGAVDALSTVVFARWGLAGTGTAVDMGERVRVDKQLALGYGDSFFTGQPWQYMVILTLFLVIFFALTAFLLSGRRETT